MIYKTACYTHLCKIERGSGVSSCYPKAKPLNSIRIFTICLYLTIMKKRTDFLIIGSGIAGLTFALKASGFGKVTIVTKASLEDSNTRYAQGGIAAEIGRAHV